MVDSIDRQAGRYKAYPEYKDSGVEWLGEIPSGWEVLPIKYVANVNMGQSPSSDDVNDSGVGLPFLQGNADFSKFSPKARTWCPVPRKIAKKGDVLFSVRAPVGAVNVADMDYGIGRGLCSIKGNELLAQKFLAWLLPSYKYQFDAISTGSTFESVSSEEVNNLLFSLPSLNEQMKIANFLDYETAKIDTLIEKQQHLIELLTEKRQAVISHAVTKGLNPDVAMKDSGVEWLGEVPAHWDVMQFRRITSLSQGLQIPQSERLYEPLDNTVEYITIKSIHAGEALENREYIYKPSSRVQCDYDDVLLARTGATGEVITDVKGAFHNNFFKVSYSDRIDKDFLVNLLTVKELKSHLLMLAGTTTIPDLNHGAFLSTKIALPHLDEQKAICKEILRQSSKFDKLLRVARQAIQLMQERRTALISAAVTGKIDVRDWVKR